MDMRVAKIEYLNNDHSSINYEYYSYDAQGNAMATYERVQNLEDDNLKLVEHHIYGTQRLGVQNSGKELKQRNVVSVPQGGSINVELSEDIVWGSIQSTSYDKTQNIVGDKRYELANHLGNVLVVVTDRKVALTPTTYTADVVSYSDYSPYGVQLDQRHGAATEGKYKYGFQGQEGDDEIKGEGNSVNYKYRMHDPRIGRFFAIDPLAPKYPHNSPYAFSENMVIHMVELEGLEAAPLLEPEPFVEMTVIRGGAASSEITIGTSAAEVGGLTLSSVFATVLSVFIPTSMGTGDMMPTPITSGLVYGDLTDPMTQQQKDALLNNPYNVIQSNPEPEKKKDDDDDNSLYIYRLMYVGVGGKPKITGQTETSLQKYGYLGARESDVKNMRKNGGSTLVGGPKNGGLSATNVNKVPDGLNSKETQKAITNGKMAVFQIKRSDLMKYGLIAIDDKGTDGTHVSIQPILPMDERAYQSAIQGTITLWNKATILP
jgi:RHS repeat-associated protein